MRERTFRELETGVETGVEVVEAEPSVLRSRDVDCGVLHDVETRVLQPSISPVAPECTADDDSNGSIARVRFNLDVSLKRRQNMRNMRGR